MENLSKPEGQTTSDNFVLSDYKNEKDFLKPQSIWGDLSDDDKNYLAKKGMKSPFELLKSYRELEKAYSSRINIPKDGDEEAFHKFYSHLGMPQNIEGFELHINQEDEPFGNAFKEACLKNNILPKSAQGLYDWFVSNREQQINQENSEWIKQSQAEMEEQKHLWGAQSARNMELMKRGIRLFSDNDDDVLKMEQALGTQNMMQIFSRLGEAVSEDNPISFGNSGKRESKFDMVEYFKEMFHDY